MLGALDERDSANGSRPASYPQESPHSADWHRTASLPSGHAAPDDVPYRSSTGGRSKRKASRAKDTDCVVMSVHSQNVHMATPIKSNEAMLRTLSDIDNTQEDKTMTASDLEQTNNKLAKMGPDVLHDHTNHLHVPGALNELKHLEQKISALDIKQKINEDDKENLDSQMHSNINTDSKEPFGHLMSVLKQVNHGLGSFPGQPRLLQLHTQETVSLPPVPRQAWPDRPNTSCKPQDIPRMPLLSLFATTPTPLTGSLYDPHEPPERDIPPPCNHQPPATTDHPPLSIPLLRLMGNHSNGPELNQHTVPRLVPPQDILNYEQKKYGTKKMMVPKDVVQHTRPRQPPTADMISRQLLRSDTMEAFGPADNRDSHKRYAPV